MLKSAIFGGSFDPPHLGHLFVVTTLLNMGFDEVRIIPVATHPLSKKCLPFPLRLQMTKLNFALFPNRVVIDEIENNLPAPSRTWDTIIQLQKIHPDSNFTLVTGEDNLAIKNNWYKWKELTAKIDGITIGRGNFDTRDPQLKIPDISSSFIRKNIDYPN
ncbi:MAG: nicotinate-nicotinamide nucleotide adenylyltransferase, partial [Deltaproteobacteria bacterium]|nr:nicotinate-nicotinamide nucleotide adenylyltransferase [Deltaproteobacteria bacterium]